MTKDEQYPNQVEEDEQIKEDDKECWGEVERATATAKAMREESLPDELFLIPKYDPTVNADEYEYHHDIALTCLNWIEENCVHVKGEWAGQKFILEPWQRCVILNLFGWYHKEHMTRRYRECFIYVPRKNGKTFLAAALHLLMLYFDGEKGAENYCVANDWKQSKLVYKPVEMMIKANPRLKAKTKIYTSFSSVQFQSNVMQALTSESKGKDGFNIHFLTVDEIHKFKERDRDLIDVLETAMGSRRQPLTLYTTTADFSRKSICNEMLDRARRIRDGKTDDPTMLPVIYEATLKDDWTDEEVWKRVNPNYGISLYVDYIKRKFNKAQEFPSFENTFKRLHLNIVTEQLERWLQMIVWDAQPKFDPDDLLGKVFYGGLDLSKTTDISSFVAFFPEEQAFLCRFWVPTKRMRLQEYEVWIRDGDMLATPGDVVDYSFIRKEINEFCCNYKCAGIAYDPWNATHMAVELSDQDGIEMIEFKQGTRTMNEPSKEFERMLLTHEVRHNDHPILRWMASNVTKYEDADGYIKPSKKMSVEMIDGIVACIMAVGLHMAGAGVSESRYNQGGGLIII